MRLSRIVMFAALALIVGLSLTLDLYFDWLWFEEVGKTNVFTTALWARSTVGSAVFLIAFLFLYGNLSYVNRGAGSIQIGIPTPAGQVTALTFGDEQVRRALILLCAVVALFFSVRGGQQWETVWKYRHAVGFGVADPVFGRDVAFYFFTLPLLEEGVRIGLTLLVIAIAGVLLLHHLKGTLGVRAMRRIGKGRAGTHASLLAAAAFALLAADAYLDRFGVLFSAGQGPMHGATYADLHGRLPLLAALAVASLAAAVLLARNAFAPTNRSALLAAGLYVGVLLLGKIYPGLLQQFVVAPDELGKESPQIRNNIDATLRAYGLDSVQDRTLSGDTALRPQDVRNNAATIQSIRLWDHEPLLDTFSQIQEIRTYYDFASVDNDRYLLDGQPQQMMLSARELNTSSLQDQKWMNAHLMFTHGYGLTLGPVNRVTSEGLPVLLVQDIPPRVTHPLFEIKRPEIYYGELTRDYVIAKTGQDEFDYPKGEQNVFTRYQGTGGVPVQSFLRKFLFALYFKNPNIILSPLVGPESRFLYFREIGARVRRVAPFLVLDRDPYLVISGGRLFWIQDAYTVADRYPYSTPTEGIGNYIRNSVKVVVDAYNGTVDLYIADPKDPLIRVYQGIYPGVFRPLTDLPPDLRLHLRYPEDIFTIQTYIYAVYHMNNPQVFYNKEDLWEVPTIASGGREKPMPPYYTVMRLPQEQEKQEEFILMVPFTPGRKDNLSAWMVARSDGEHYGQLVVYRFPKQKLVYGPKQIVARINQDAEISRQISLWDQRGSQVIQGTILVIPIEEALVYVRPLYIRAESGKIPELKRVIVAYENRIAMEETLEGAFARIFSGEIGSRPPAAPSPPPEMTEKGKPAPQPAPGQTQAALVQQAAEAYERAMAAQRQGDWARYGEEIKKVGALLGALKGK
jgi:uncharacterized membrane protein (UPF0182 family)